jgi:hypothetical protein
VKFLLVAGVPQHLSGRAFPNLAEPEERDGGRRRDGFFQYLQALSPDVDAGIAADAGEVAGPGEAGHKPRFDWIFKHVCNSQNRACCRLEGDQNPGGNAYDPSGVRGHDLLRQVGITLVMPLGRIAVDDQVLIFDITQPAQIGEKSAPKRILGDQGSRDCRVEDR